MLSFTDALQFLKTKKLKELATVLLLSQWQREVEKQTLCYLTLLFTKLWDDNHGWGAIAGVMCSKSWYIYWLEGKAADSKHYTMLIIQCLLYKAIYAIRRCYNTPFVTKFLLRLQKVLEANLQMFWPCLLILKSDHYILRREFRISMELLDWSCVPSLTVYLLANLLCRQCLNS